ncbi:sel1 repeat family protein [Pseudomonas sp. ABC1]|uniref:tetratricopeptide repeat protein n=1 Tax=Pseudomonas sp. ABC1 TaxID=2748080 RepID=UPI0015C35BBA|nr:SEL1-like repeat protein [Pseudomonas sp. ABC1]QLF91714.1 sel1 repeat family protein [Pseudomonas sp. ABC1]
MIIWKIRARVGYWAARRLLGWRWAVAQPRLWRWMEGQFSRMANLGDRDAQGFYGHLLLFRGQGLGSRQEGMRLLERAAQAGDAKAAYQVGCLYLDDHPWRAADPARAAHWWGQAADAGHPLAASRLGKLYESGAEGLPSDPALAQRYLAQAARLGL